MSLLGERLEGKRVWLQASGEREYDVRRVADGAVIGRIAFVEDGDVLVVGQLWIEPGHRGFGAGSEAAALLRDGAEGEGRWVALRACAPAGAGLAVYYWMRMGLRPAGAEEGGGLRFERALRTP